MAPVRSIRPTNPQILLDGIWQPGNQNRKPVAGTFVFIGGKLSAPEPVIAAHSRKTSDDGLYIHHCPAQWLYRLTDFLTTEAHRITIAMLRPGVVCKTVGGGGGKQGIWRKVHGSRALSVSPSPSQFGGQSEGSIQGEGEAFVAWLTRAGAMPPARPSSSWAPEVLPMTHGGKVQQPSRFCHRRSEPTGSGGINSFVASGRPIRASWKVQHRRPALRSRKQQPHLHPLAGS